MVQPPAKRVLMLFGEGKDVPANIMLEQAVRSEMQTVSSNKLEFLGEYLDASHFSNEEHIRVFKEYLGKKYAAQHPDLLLVFPSRDYSLVSDLPKQVFPGVPVVFLAVNEREIPAALAGPGIAGIVQRLDIRGTLGLAVRLQPDIRKVVVVGGVSESDHATVERIGDAAQAMTGIDFDFWTNRPITEVMEAVKSLPDGTVLILSSVQRDVAGQSFFTSQLAAMISPVARVPVYVFGGWSLGSGALGGSVVDPADLGERAGKLAAGVLDHGAVAGLPVEIATKGTPMVDWRALRRWGIAESRMPAGCLIRYRPETLWGQHKQLIVFSMAVFLAQAVTIAGLIVQRRHRLRAETEILEQRTELAHVTRVSAMGHLSSAIAHELNQPLGAIMRNVDAAELFLQRPAPDLGEIRTILSDIRADDQRAGRVIEQMRSLLKRRAVELLPLNIGEVLAETIALTRPDAQMRHVSLVAQLPARLPEVRGDRVHLQQVLLNLILNGMDSMVNNPPGSRTLTVRLEALNGGGAEVSVEDCGVGIAADDMKKLFIAFFTTKTSGMGMGLAISRTIVEAHGGKIWAENKPGKGAVFKFTLPAKES